MIDSSGKETEVIEIKITKEEIDKLEGTLNSLRNYGYAHVDIENKQLIFSCDSLIKNKENRDKDMENMEVRH